jgi:hypothetical protein
MFTSSQQNGGRQEEPKVEPRPAEGTKAPPTPTAKRRSTGADLPGRHLSTVARILLEPLLK